MRRVSVGLVRALLAMGLVLGAATRANAIEYQDGRLQIHGFGEVQLRGLARDFEVSDGFDLAQWYNVLNAELEYDLAPDGFGPFEFLSAYARIEVRYDCVWTRACGLFPSADTYGDRANKLPGRLSDAETDEGFPGNKPVDEFVGVARVEPHTGALVLPDHRPGGIETSALEPLFEAPNVPPEVSDLLFARFDDFRFAQVDRPGSLDGHGEEILGPFLPKNFVNPLAEWADIPNPLRAGDRNPVLSGLIGTDVFGTGELPFRPAPVRPSGADVDRSRAQGLWYPSARLRDVMGDLDSQSHDQNFRQAELEWNRGASQQDEKELKELYVDLEMLEGALWGRIGKQTIVWGKTELFRNQDQFNPQDLALANLPSLEESRIGLWAARLVYSFYEVGPLSDVRLEGAVNFDQFEPADIGDCGEPFTPDPVCYLKAQGLFAFGVTGLGLAGEERPPDPWNSTKGLEGGLRLEFRWKRFSFAITDFYGFNDLPTQVKFNTYERNVYPETGRPRAINQGGPCVTGAEPACLQPGTSGPNNALDFHHANQTVHAAVCAATVGVLDPSTSTCLTTLPNSSLVNIVGAFANGLSGQGAVPALPAGVTVGLNTDVNDDPISGKPLSSVLTNEQEALLGCGPFYGTSCDDDGIDFLNAESSVLFQSWLGFEGTPLRPAPGKLWTDTDPETGLSFQEAFLTKQGRFAGTPNPGTLGFDGGPVATRFRPGTGLDEREFVQLPGARSPFLRDGVTPNPEYDPTKDGTIAGLFHPFAPSQQFRSEMAALSWNFQQMGVFLSRLSGDDPSECAPETPLTCTLLAALMSASRVQNPVVSSRDPRFGRRDFLWHMGSENLVRYDKNNILGLGMDFAEDWSKTNWGIELTWVNDLRLNDARSFSGTSEVDQLNLTVSFDRPTIINFLNPNRSFFVNVQSFIGYSEDYEKSFAAPGPFQMLNTLTIFTGYFKDRLNPFVTFVWEVETNAGAILASIDYRYSARFRVVFGVNGFAGKWDRDPMPVNVAEPVNRVGEHAFSNFSMQGITPAMDRDEVFLRLRYTF